MKLKEWRARRGLTLKEVGDLVGRHFTTIDKWEGGQIPCPDDLRKIYEITDGAVTPCAFAGVECPCELARSAKPKAAAA